MLQSSFLPAARRTALRALLNQGAWMVLVGALLLGAFAVTWRLYQERLEEARLGAYRHLASISELRAAQVEAWLDERKADAATLAARHDARSREALPAIFEAYRRAYGYEAVMLLDAAGRVQVATAGAGELSADARAAAREAAQTDSVQVEGVRVWTPGGASVRVAVIAPLADGTGAILLRADPYPSLFHSLERWSLPATSGETVIVEHDGEVFSYLAPERRGAAAKERPAIPQPSELVAQAVRDAGGPLEGIDYRGVPSIGAAQGVKGTDWLVISKMNAADAYTGLKREALLLAALCALSIAGAATGAAWWRRGQRLRLVSRQRAAEERLAAIVQSSDDAIMHVGLDGRIGAWNEGAERLFGYGADEMIGQPLARLVPPDLQEREAALFARVHAGEPIVNHATRRVAKGGGTVEVLLSVRPVRNSQGRVVAMAGIARDMSGQRRADAERERLARLYRALTSLNELAARSQSEQALLEGVCEAAVGIGEFQTAAVRLVDPATLLSHRVAMRGEETAAFARPLDMRAGSRDQGTLAWRAYRTRRVAIASAAEIVAGMPHAAAEVGGASAGAYPIFRRGECVGVLLLRSAAPDIFTGAVHELLERMANDVSHALDALAAADELRRFRVALDNSADLILIADTATLRFVDANNTACRLLGYSRDELIGMHCTQVLPQTADEMNEAYAALIAQPGASGSLRSYYRCKDGSRLPFESTRHVLREGERWLVAAISRDMRERDAAEQAARQKDRYFASLLANLSDAVGACDTDWRLLYLSPSCETLLGYRPDEMLGRQFGVTIPDAERWRQRLGAALAAGEGPQRTRVPLLRKDGVERVQEIVVSRGRGPEGEPIYVLVGRDVTDQEQREQEFATLVQNSPDVIARWDSSLRLYFVNDAVSRPTGTDPATLLGKRMHEIGAPEAFATQWETCLRRARETGAEVSAQMAYPGAEGMAYYDARFVPEMGGDGAVHSVMTIARDITDRVRTEQALAASERRFRALLEHSADAIVVYNRESQVLYRSPAVTHVTGFTNEERRGQSIGTMVVEADLPVVREQLAEAMAHPGASRPLQCRLRHKDGSVRWIEGTLTNLLDEPAVAGVVANFRDVTERVRAQEELKHAEQLVRENEMRLRAIVQATPSPLLVVSREGGILFANPAAADLLGRRHAELPGLPLGLPLADHRPADVELVLPAGGTRPAEMQAAPALFDGREVLIVSLHDLSERREYERHIERLANHDSLTGLPNRTLVRDRVEQAIIHARRSGGHVALLFVDLDQFKLVNDSWGHVMGDALLVEVGRRLQQTVRDGDTVARLGGDEFVILLSALGTPGDTSVVAGKIADALAAPLELEGRQVSVTASIGISLYPGDGHDLESLLQCADAAMYRAKEAGRNGYQYYGAEMGAQARARVETEQGLRQALERGELRLHYQPQVELESGRIRGFEALMRWQHPRLGMVSPASFIPVAEDSGLILPMGQWALREACKQAAAWSAGRLGKLKVAVNLSARQFWRGGVTDAVSAALAESGLPASQLELEITESTVARDLQLVTMTLEQLRRLGVTIAIDDFGTGYSSLAYLRSLPIQKVKIDRTFVQGIPDDADSTALVGEIIRLAHVLRLEVVAEGVETAAQAAFLREAGCEALQGYLVARPMPGDDCAPLLRERRRYAF